MRHEEEDLNARLLASALTGVISGEISYSSASLEDKIYLVNDIIKYHEKYPISTSKDIVNEAKEKLKELTNERAIAMGIRDRVESITPKGVQSPD